jgi:hypothetical protein
MTMHARVTIANGDPARADEAVEAFRQGALQIVSAAAGYKGALLLIDRESGRGMGISLWESEEAMRATEEAMDAFRASLPDSGMGAPTVERYEVAIYETP